MNHNPVLSDREKEVAALLMQGKSNKQIAQDLGISTRTAEFHISNIYAKIGVTSRAEAILRLSEIDQKGPQSGHLRESTGTAASSKLRESTVEKGTDLSENDHSLIFLNRRITMKTLLPLLLAAAAISCAALAYFGSLVMQNGGGMGLAANPGAQATYTPYEPTYTPFAPTYTPYEPTPTADASAQIPGDSAGDGAAQPTPTAWRIPPEGNRIRFLNVSFDLVPEVASGARGRAMLENREIAGGPFWETYPQHARIELDGYPLDGQSFEPVIAVYPVEAYRQLSEYAGQTIDDLKTLLDQKPDDGDRIPFLPLINAGQTFHSNVEYLDFQNGSGVRYLAVFAQYPAPVNSKDLIYTFQGLTSDGKYYVSVVLPVNHPSLPTNADALSIDELDTIVKDYDNYRARMASALEAQPADSFIPNLGAVDELVKTLQVEE